MGVFKGCKPQAVGKPDNVKKDDFDLVAFEYGPQETAGRKHSYEGIFLIDAVQDQRVETGPRDSTDY